ncbi:MAG: hypothetical protein H6Q86_1646 [candidate division NC10 bacterium]|nr:hypothetical protein [candidate division NC10 bacterium]
MSEQRSSMIGSVLLAVGIAAGGWFVGHGFVTARMGDRFVTVKGISERDVKADLAIWSVRIAATDNDLPTAQRRITEDVSKVRDFLARHGIAADQTELERPEVEDAFANQWRDASKVKDRYIVHQTVTVRLDKPETVVEASRQSGELVAAGVVLATGQGYGQGGGPRFLFTRLNDIKPQMIQEATARAREAALKFAQDSSSTLGGIRQASQGVFEILPRNPVPGVDEASQLLKTVRVVSTVQYFLEH